VLVCGLPGAGKSTLVREAKLTVPCTINKVVIYTLAQDEIYERFRIGTSHAQFSPDEWKKSREELVKTVEQILKHPLLNDLWVVPS